jgi:prepilin-type N-terminal cleavage/methylation domain-containing protein
MKSESGFTLVEVLIAIVILAFGLIAVTNLMVVAGSSNSVANHTTAAATEATEVLERLKAIPFLTLAAGGNLTADAGSTLNCDATPAPGPATECAIAGNYNQMRNIPGVGWIKTRWVVRTRPSIDIAGQQFGSALFITVRSEGLSPLTGQRSRAEFTTFRVCASGTPQCP